MPQKDDTNSFKTAKELFLLGLEFFENGAYEDAEKYFQKSLEIIPNRLSTLINLGATLLELHKLDEAYETIKASLKLDSHNAEALLNLGNYYSEQEDWGKAIPIYDEAISIKSNYTEAYFNRGTALQETRRLHAAVADYDKTIETDADFAEAYWSKSHALLLDGNFLDGWELYEWRWKSKSTELKSRSFPQPLWLGKKSLKEKTILLYSEQGLGDTIQFCRYAKLVKELGARVLLEVSVPLIPLLRQLECVDEFIEVNKPLPNFDYHCPLISLPLAFKTQLDSIPSYQAYLRSDSNKVVEWKARLGEKSKLLVGLVWSGNTSHKKDRRRSIALDTLLPYLPSNFQYVCLQKEVRDVDKDALQRSSIRYFGDQISDFADTAALCELVDVLISVDTSVAHLAGALGKRAWVLLPYVPDWRWLLDRDDSPWYESMRLYRQDVDRDWRKVLMRAVNDLHKLSIKN